MEKKLFSVDVRMTEQMKRDLQDVAMYHDRSLSDQVRVLLEAALYGLKHRHDEVCVHLESRHTSSDKSR